MHGWVSFVAGGLLGLVTLVWLEKLWIMLIALPLIGLGYLYNSGQKPLSYSRSGEWVTAICYGGVFSCLWLVSSQELGSAIILGSLSFGSLAVALLLAHQPCQIDTDCRVNKRTFAVRFGKEKTYQMVRVLFLFFFVIWHFLLFVTYSSLMLPILGLIIISLMFGSRLYKVPL